MTHVLKDIFNNVTKILCDMYHHFYDIQNLKRPSQLCIVLDQRRVLLFSETSQNVCYKNVAKLTGKHRCQGIFSNKVTGVSFFRSFLRIWSHLLMKSLMENSIFVHCQKFGYKEYFKNSDFSLVSFFDISLLQKY